MGNCLFTELKSVVNNDSLPRLGEMRIDVHHTSSPTDTTQKIEISFYDLPSAAKIYVLGGAANITTDSTMESDFVSYIDINDTNNHILYLKNGDYSVFVTQKYYIKWVTNIGNSIGCNLSDLKYNYDLRMVGTESPYVIGNLNDCYNGRSLTAAGFDFQQATGVLNSHLDMSETITFDIGGNISGNIESLDFTGNSSIYRISLYSLLIKGDIKTMLENLWSKGRRGNITVMFNSSSNFQCTYDGEPPYSALGGNYIVFTLDSEGVHKN